ncbi:4-hydroxythreonine-4-phosphate dehydrogenase PdxA [Flavobacteriales bacterium]|jgi:4-hydroxythreonine-4-phosphate dehydrogenase|nr:4-hydroxythreonine-4-phosphate dehydrogenase PdxA [Flavobacteriales bacterium]MDB9931735.1 4-hydroxythreonine-4-phosphate dehydrogenase PdxA [Flavobacteriales bacterium]MDC1370383.1 4-hydroxythreonine-4-phosphate dehydrogenase PdxA [Flavobacteriales bacterium]
MSNSSNKRPIRVGISIGDVNGIGPEVILKTFSDNRLLDFVTPVIYSSASLLSAHRKSLDLQALTHTNLEEGMEAKSKTLYIKKCWDKDPELNIGKETPEGGEYAIKSLRAATDDLASSKIDVLVTAPINKHNVQSSEFKFPGHTEFLAKLSNVDKALMLMVADNLKVAVVSGHIPLKEVAKTLTKEKIVEAITQLNESLIKDFGISRPKIAVMGLNPHAGDNGVIGDEEKEIIIPAIAEAKGKGILAFGPYSADGFFGSSTYTHYDGILAMYHDQGLVPFKSLSFGNGVNYTAGLPIVRTSPDHGTGFDIAGKNEASESSFRNALYLAMDIYRNRNEHKEMTANPLQRQK